MSHNVEISINAVNVALSLIIVVLILGVARMTNRQGLEVVGARLYLRKKQTARAAVLIISGLAIFILSNVLELLGDVFHLDWYVNEIVETLSLLPMIAGLVLVRTILQTSSKVRAAASLEVSEAGGR